MHRYRTLLGGLATLALLAVNPAPGAEGAIVGETVVYEVGGTAYEGYDARNIGLVDGRPVVVIVHDWDGLGDDEKRRARISRPGPR